MRFLYAILFFVLYGIPVNAAVAYVSSGAAVTPGSVSSFTIVHTLTNGDMENVCVATASTGVYVTSMTDNGSAGGSTYLLRQSGSNGTSIHTELWSTSHNGITGSPTIITVNLSGTSDVSAVDAMYSGVTSPALVGQANAASSTNASSATLFIWGAQTGVGLACSGSLGTATWSGTNLRTNAVDLLLGVGIGDKSVTAENGTIPTMTLSSSQVSSVMLLELQGVSTGTPTGRFVQGGVIYVHSAPGALGYHFVFDKPVTAGNLILACPSLTSTSATNSFSDTLGNSYVSPIGPILDSSSTYRMYAFYAKNITGGSDIVTINSPSSPQQRIAYGEYTTADAGSPIDKTSSGTNAGTSASSGSATTSYANEMVYGCVGNSVSTTWTAGIGSINSTESHIATESAVETSTGSYAATMTVTSGNWLALMLTTVDTGQIVSSPSQVGAFFPGP